MVDILQLAAGMLEQQPSVGRIVHVVGYNGRCDAAIVTAVASPTVIGVTRFPARSSPYPQSNLTFAPAEDGIADSWHWPELT